MLPQTLTLIELFSLTYINTHTPPTYTRVAIPYPDPLVHGSLKVPHTRLYTGASIILDPLLVLCHVGRPLQEARGGCQPWHPGKLGPRRGPVRTYVATPLLLLFSR